MANTNNLQMYENWAVPRPSDFFHEILDKLEVEKPTIYTEFECESGITVTGLRLLRYGSHATGVALYAFTKCQCEAHGEDDDIIGYCIDKQDLYAPVSDFGSEHEAIYKAFDNVIALIECSRHCGNCDIIEKKVDLIGSLCLKCYGKRQFEAYKSAKTLPVVKGAGKE